MSPFGTFWYAQKDYFKAVETLLNVVFRLVPRACTVAMIATAMPAAIRPYSIAVAPDWSFQNRDMPSPLVGSVVARLG